MFEAYPPITRDLLLLSWVIFCLLHSVLYNAYSVDGCATLAIFTILDSDTLHFTPLAFIAGLH